MFQNETKPTDYRNRIKALEYVNSADLAAHPGISWVLRYGFKIGGDAAQYALRPSCAHARRKPYVWHFLVLPVITPADPMTEGNDIELVRFSTREKRYPVVGSDGTDITSSTTDGARITPVSKTPFPVLGGEVATRKSKRQLPRSIPESNCNPVSFSIAISRFFPFLIMALIGITIFSQSLLAVGPVVSLMPFTQAFFIRRPILDGISEPSFTLALIACLIAGARLFYIRIVRALFPFFNQVGIFLSLPLHIFTRGFPFTLDTDSSPPIFRFRQFPLALRTSFHQSSLQDVPQ